MQLFHIKILRKLFLLIIFSLTSFSAFSQCMTYVVPMQEKVNGSSAIIEGKVIARQSFWNANSSFIYTSNIIEVYKVFKGSVSTNQIEIITEGGIVGNQMIKVEPALELEINETGVFFLIATSNLNPASPFLPSNQFEGFAANQSLIKYDLKDGSAVDGLLNYSNIATQVYQPVIQMTGQNYTEIIQANFIQTSNSGPGGNPVPLVFPTITTILPSPLTAGTFSLVTISGNNFGAGPYGGTRALEFRDANNGGAGLFQLRQTTLFPGPTLLSRHGFLLRPVAETSELPMI
ncbi:MAG: hypothetical protein IPN13_22385 [Bacteroidetes bacterium]|nr:hypothetical protein [Bacteroidota bacterium]